MRITSIALGVLMLAMAAAGLSCQKDENEAEKFERADNETFKRDMSELSSFSLANGVTVYLQEEHTRDQTAVEVFYPVGFMDEPAGEAQVSHMAEHLTMYCANSAFGTEEGFKLLRDNNGMLNAETLAGFMHFDYIVARAHLEDALRVEAARLGEMKCDEAILKREQAKVIEEIDYTLANPKLALTKFAMTVLNQVMNHDQTRVDIRAGANRVTIPQVERFHREQFRPDDMIIVIIGDFKKPEVEAMVRSHFESIPRRPAPPVASGRITRDTRVSWDVEANAVFYVAPGPYANYRERLILSLFGSYLQQFLTAAPALYGGGQVVYCSNPVYRVGEIPFFVYDQPGPGRSTAEVMPVLVQHIDRAVQLLDEDARIDSIKGSAISFMTTSILKPSTPDYPMEHHQVIGQEALNVGIKHFLREGRNNDDYIAVVNGITPEEFRSVVRNHLSRSKMFEVSLEPHQ